MARARSLTEFQETFPDEASCATFLFDRRWPDGFVCPVCGNGRAAALKSRAYTYECSDCGRQTSITAGTALHRTKLPLTVWFWAAHLMSTHSNGMSARQLEDQLGLTYRTAWLLTQKLRRSMVDPDRSPLEGVVEVDQAEIPIHRRNKLIVRLQQQIALVQDPQFTLTRQKWIVDENGVKQLRELRKKVRAWWRTDPTGAVVLTVRYGSKPIEFEKGKSAIVVGKKDKLIPTIETVIAAVEAGELDGVLGQMSKSSSQFVKGKLAA